MLARGAARWLIIPTKSDAASVTGMARIAQRLVQAREQNPHIELLGVVLFDVPTAATRMRRDITAEITAALGGVAPVFTSSILHSVAAVAARGRGLLIHEHAGELVGEPFWKALREGRTRPTRELLPRSPRTTRRWPTRSSPASPPGRTAGHPRWGSRREWR